MSAVRGAGMDDAHDPLDLPRRSARVAHPGSWRVVAAALILVAWVFGAVAIALIPPWALSPMSYAGFVGATIGSFLGAIRRNHTRGARVALSYATRDAGALAIGVLSASWVGIVLRPAGIVEPSGVTTELVFAMTLLIATSSACWDGGRSRNARNWVGVGALIAAGLALLGLPGPSPVLIVSGLAALLVLAVLWRSIAPDPSTPEGAPSGQLA